MIEWMTIIGLAAAVFTTIAFLPQAIKSIKTKQTRDISLPMYVIFTTGVFLWLVYGITISDIPLILANGVTFILAGVILVLKIKHS